MDFSKYLFRAHMVGKIIDTPKPLTENQSNTLISLEEKQKEKPLTTAQHKTYVSLKNKQYESEKIKLSETSKKVLDQLTFAEKYSRRITLNSPKLTKGIEVEKNSRDILTRVSGLFLTASTERKYNDFTTGAIDIEPADAIIDIKSSWSWESFTKIMQDKPNKLYLHQGDTYMDLWDKKKFILCHVLTDTPIEIVEDQLKRLAYNKRDLFSFDGNVRDESIDEVKLLINNFIYSRKALEEFCNYSASVHIEWFTDFEEIPEKDRVHMIEHDYQKERIEQRNKSIILAREYMNTSKPLNRYYKL